MVGGHQMTPDMARLECLARGLQDKLDLNLIGVDVIIENNTGRYAVIDINAFPGQYTRSLVRTHSLTPGHFSSLLSPAAPKARDGRYCNAPPLMYILETLQVRAPCHGGVLYSF